MYKYRARVEVLVVGQEREKRGSVQQAGTGKGGGQGFTCYRRMAYINGLGKAVARAEHKLFDVWDSFI